MTSIIKVDQIQNAAGGVPTAADLGLNVSGALLQMVSASIGGSIYTTSTSNVDTGLSVSITPKFANSKIKLTLQGGRPYTANQNLDVTLYIDGVAYGNGGRWYTIYSQTYGIHVGHSAMIVLDANNTNQRTYNLKFRTGNGTVYFNNHNPASDEYDVWFIAEEIAG